jgi:hypothetical protein
MNRKLQLYIQGERIDMFNDESISITQSIQNVKDIDKIFTSFTKSFTIPASKTNNKIFKHYYNYNIENGFDGRKKVTATIEINDIPFQKGKIKLEGVDMKTNKPYAYRITFFGDIVELKDLIGEDKLSDLPLSTYDENYSSSNVKSKLQADPSTNDVIVPLITHTKRLYYDSGDNQANTGNLYNQPAINSGVAFSELKFALRLNKIIEAIESKYGLTFSSDFFKNTSNPDFHNLFMWLHRKRGSSTSEGIAEEVTISPDFFLNEDDTGNMTCVGNQIIIALPYVDKLNRPAGTSRWDDFDLDINVDAADQSKNYTLRVLRNGTSIFSTGVTSGNANYNWNAVFSGIETDNDIIPAGTYTIEIITTQDITFTKIDFDVIIDDDDDDVDQARTLNVNTANFIFNVQQQIPNIGVLKFLTGLFNTFNLTAFFEDNVLIVKSLDEFYANPTVYDISEFVEVNTTKVDVALPYREISFKFNDTKSFFASIHNQLFNTEWGEIEYRGGANENDVLAGRRYKVENAFGKMKYERLVDNNDNIQTGIMWGWCVDDKQGPILISPLIFYPVYFTPFKSGAGINLNYVSVVDEDGTYDTVETLSGAINYPSNSLSTDASTSTVNINYNNELNEFTGTNDFTDTLFQKRYRTYIEEVFDPKARLTKVSANLSLNILTNLRLSDLVCIGQNTYKINSMTTNLLTGKTDFELLNYTENY